MKYFVRFFWTIVVMGIVIIAVNIVYNTFSDQTVHAQVMKRFEPKMAPSDTVEMDEVPADRVQQDAEQAMAIRVDRRIRMPTHTDIELYLSFGVLLFGFFVMLGQFAIMIRERRYFDNMSLKMLTITMAVTSALFLITAGFSSDQIQPAIGLISGTLGFAFGLRGDTPADASQNSTPRPTPTPPIPPSIKP
jgi:hypothetical protein